MPNNQPIDIRAETEGLLKILEQSDYYGLDEIADTEQFIRSLIARAKEEEREAIVKHFSKLSDCDDGDSAFYKTIASEIRSLPTEKGQV